MSKGCFILKTLKPICNRWTPPNSFLSLRYTSTNLKSDRSVLAVSGIQPSGKPHLGNYLGVIKPCVTYCRSGGVSQFFMMIADLHALTSQNCTTLQNGIRELAATLLACGFEARSLKHLLFLQSCVIGHTELAWILSSACSFRRLTHLPQWKEKSGYYDSVSNGIDNNGLQITNVYDTATVGLFTYPVLQASDILLYGAHVVPVGVDQLPHIELARDLVRTVVHKWPSLSPILRIPDSLIFETPKVANLRNPTKKMSKSDPSELGIIYLTDTPDMIHKKIKRAETDHIKGISYDVGERPGVSNLLRILAAIEGRSIEDILLTSSQWNKEDLKSKVTDAVIQEFDPIRKRIHDLMYTDQGQSTVADCLAYGAEQANLLTTKRLESIYSAVGCKIPVRQNSSFASFNCITRIPI
ncbi:unnamed protein product [Heterobilharzia americana]|nr:unnamed protein product [Heterobilharzia americana]